jgi:hypothetical protein
MHDEKAAAIRGLMHDVMVDLDGAETHSAIASDGLVVITRNKDDPRSLAGLAKKLLQHIIVRLQPERAPPDAPEIDNIANEIDRVGVVVAEEIKKGFRLTCPCAEMQI